LFTALSAFAQNPSAPQPQEPPHTPTSAGQPVNAPTAPAGTTEAKQPGVLAPGKTDQGEDKYIFGVLPNYRTAEMDAIGHPLTVKRKMLIAVKDSFSYQLVAIGAVYATLYQADDTHPEFGQGVEGYVKRFSASYGDQVIGNVMTEGVFPSLLKEDPRYFRMDHGGAGKRLFYAVSRIIVTKTDKGETSVNWSELMGNAAASGIGLSYYPDSRNPGDYVENWATQLGTDAFSQVLKEFWPDVKKWLRRKRGVDAPMSEVPPSQRH
jgi:hypothetical protein